MTAGKVMAAIKVDMCRQQQNVPQIVAAPPSVVDLLRNRRRGAAARVCLFGAPEPGATRRVYDDMLDQQHQYMLNRYQFDTKTDRYVGAETDGIDNQPPMAAAGPTSSTQNGGTVANARAVQQRLQGAAAHEHTPPREVRRPSAFSSDGEASGDEVAVEDEKKESAERLRAPEKEEEAVKSSESNVDHIAPIVATVATATSANTNSSAAVARGRASGKATRSVAQKPYDKGTRPITDFYRKSKRTTVSIAKITADDSHTVAISPALVATELPSSPSQ